MEHTLTFSYHEKALRPDLSLHIKCSSFILSELDTADEIKRRVLRVIRDRLKGSLSGCQRPHTVLSVGGYCVNAKIVQSSDKPSAIDVSKYQMDL